MSPEINRRDVEDRVRQIKWPAPSQALRDRVLSTAVVAAPLVAWSDRMWFSRGWRLAAVGAALAIVVLDQIAASPRPAAFATTPQALAEAQAIDEAGRQVGLPPEVAALLARRVLSDASRTRVHLQSVSELLDEFSRGGGGD